MNRNNTNLLKLHTQIHIFCGSTSLKQTFLVLRATLFILSVCLGHIFGVDSPDFSEPVNRDLVIRDNFQYLACLRPKYSGTNTFDSDSDVTDTISLW